MRKFILAEKQAIAPFNEAARELRILNKPLWLTQRDVLAAYCETEKTIDSLDLVPRDAGASVVYRDNLYFDQPFIDEFFRLARARGVACRAACSATDKAFMTYAWPLSRSFEESRDISGQTLYLLDLWYYPQGYTPAVVPVIVPSGAAEVGYYSVPSYMSKRGDLTHYLTRRTVMAIDNWVHVFYANVVLGMFSLGYRFEQQLNSSNFFRLSILWTALVEQKQVLSCSKLVHVGEGTVIDPSAIIQGPTWIGRNCTIGPGVVIGNCVIGDNVNIAQGCELMLSIVSDGCFLPFRSALFMTAVMENSIIAQNTCLQMCVIGRDSFIGAGTTFTDFNLLPTPLKVEAVDGTLETIDQVVLGGCVGHNCRIGSGLVIYPGRSIESDVILFSTPSRRVVRKNISYEESDHHELRPEIAALHRQKYPRQSSENVGEGAYLESW